MDLGELMLMGFGAGLAGGLGGCLALGLCWLLAGWLSGLGRAYRRARRGW